MPDRRLTYSTAWVLQALAAGFRYGFDIAEATGIRGGTVYPLLRRLEERGLLAAAWEDPEIGREEGRPPRKYYRLRPEAAELVEAARRRHPWPAGRASAPSVPSGEAAR